MNLQIQRLSTGARIAEVDGLRGIAILLVVSFHYLNNQLVHASHNIGKVLALATSFGWVGVDLFFVLSGFLIGTILLKTRNSPRYLQTFFIRRVVRIIPNYYLLLIVYFLIVSLPYFAGNYFLTGNNVIPSWSYFAMVNNLFMASLENLGNSVLSVTWSISIEEQFHLLFPFVVFFLKEKWLPYFLVAAIIGAPLFRVQFSHWIPPYVLLPSRMDGLAFGILIAYIGYKTDVVLFVNKYFSYILAGMVVDVLVCAIAYANYGDLGVVKHTLFSFFFAGCLLIALTRPKSLYCNLLRNSVLGWIGMISYSLYLCHYFILGLVHHILGQQHGIGIYDSFDILLTVLSLLLSLLVAWGVYRGLEAPMVRLGKKFNY